MQEEVGSVNDGSAQKQALPLAKIAILAAATAGLLALVLLFPFEGIQHWGWDFAVFRASSKAFLHGQNPYDPASVSRFSDGAELASIPNFVYAPIFAILISPLSLLEPWLASRAWFVINIIACTAAVAAILRGLQWTPTPRGFLLIVLGLAAFPPLRTLLVIGQSGGIMLLLLALSFLFLSRGRQFSAGAALGLALFKPHLVLLPIFLVMRRQGKAVLALLATSIVISVPFWKLLDDWAISMISTRADNLGYGCLAFSSLAALVRCFLDGPFALALFTLILFLVGYFFVQQDASPQSSIFALQMGLVVSLSLLVIDNVRVADLILLIFAFVVVLSQLSEIKSNQLRRGAIALLVAAFLFPYLAQIFGMVTAQPILFDMPIWYASMPVTLFAATALLLLDRRRVLKS